MRTVINISLPAPMVKQVKKTVKDENYATVSEFFRALLREHEKSKILAELQQSQAEIHAGKGKKLTSLKELR